MKKILALIVAAILCMTLFTACGGNNAAAPAANEPAANAPAADGAAEPAAPADGPVTVTIGSTFRQFVGAFDPCQLANDQVSLPAGYLAFDALLRMEVLDDGTEDYYSDILESIDVDENQENLVMVLKPGVTFSNGEEMDGYDILYSLERKGNHPRLAGDYKMFDFVNASVDGNTITIPLNSFRGDWRVILEAAIVLNADWVAANGGTGYAPGASGEMGSDPDADFNWTDPAMVCGSGPYKVTEYVAEDHVTYVKRDDWWQADTAADNVAQPDVIITKLYADATTMMADYQNGVLDMVFGLSETQYNQVAADASLGTAVKAHSKSVVSLVLDVDNTPELQDVELRKAIAMGTNIADLAIVSYGDLSEPVDGIISLNSAFGSTGYSFTFDPDAAKAKITELGYEGLTLPMIANSADTAMAEVWQEQMRTIGINIDLQVYDVQTCIQYWLQPGSTAFQLLGGDNANIPGDPTTMFNNMRVTTDLACLRKMNDEWNAMLVEAQNGATVAERKAGYDAIQAFNMENVYAVPIVEWDSAYAYGNTGIVKDFIGVNPSACNLRRIVIE